MRILLTKPLELTTKELADAVTRCVYEADLEATYVPADNKWSLADQNDWCLRIEKDGQCEVTMRGGQLRTELEAIVAAMRNIGLHDAHIDPP